MKTWKDELKLVIDKNAEAAEVAKRGEDDSKSAVANWIKDVAKPTFEEVAYELRGYGREVTVYANASEASLTVNLAGRMEMQYTLVAHFNSRGHHLYTRVRSWYGGKMLVGETSVNEGTDDTIERVTQHDLIQSILREYRHTLGQF